MKLFSTEQISKYHPDKMADQISDAILTACLKGDPDSRVACETMVKNRTVVLAGEITTQAKIDIFKTVQKVAKKLDYKIDEVINLLDKQSLEIASAVDNPLDENDLGAGDQGMMFGYATRETESMLPYGFDLANRIIKAIEENKDNLQEASVFRGDAKTMVTVDLHKPAGPESLHTILISACHVKNLSLQNLKSELLRAMRDAGLPEFEEGVKKHFKLIVNPAGPWTIGGPTADSGLTGRKIVCDQYGGYTPVGGGAFSGKDPSKVDRSASYAARKLAVDLLKEHSILKWVEVQIAYAIGQPLPISINVKTNKPDIDHLLNAGIDYMAFTPAAIISRLNLKHLDYEKLAEGCHYNGCFR
jgi:S-adenosylmethionine synthetase